MKRRHRLRLRRLPKVPEAPPLWRVALWVWLFGTEVEWALMVGLFQLRLGVMLMAWASLNEPFMLGRSRSL